MLARIKWFVVAVAAAIIVGLLLGRTTFRPKPAVVEESAAAIMLAPGVQQAQKIVVTTPPPVPHVLPKGSRVLREEAITVTPSSGHEGKAVHVDATLVETQDGQTHLITSSPDGTTDATDTVVQDTRPKIEPATHHLTVGLGGPNEYLVAYTQHLFWKVSGGAAVTFNPTAVEKTKGYLIAQIDW